VGGRADGDAPKALQVYVSQLRKLLGHDRVLTRPEGYLLRADPGEVDLTRFQHLVGEGKPRDALELWRGAPLGEFADRAFAQAAVARLEELYLACLVLQVDEGLVGVINASEDALNLRLLSGPRSVLVEHRTPAVVIERLDSSDDERGHCSLFRTLTDRA
jgi:transcriptional activator